MELLTGNILGFMLVFTRVGAFFSVSPVFSWNAIPVRTKTAIAILVSLFFASINTCPVRSQDIHFVQVILLLANEALYGLALGYIAVVLFSTVPLSGENAQPVSMIMEMIFILLFLSANGHHIFLIAVSKSYETFPIATIPDIAKLTESVITAGSTMFTLALKMAVPILAAFLLMMVVLAILARIAPETNILFLSLPLRVGLGLLMVGIFLPFINQFVTEIAQWLDKIMPI
jgi:flagellar biosynthetic protein FliR